jgi:protein-S-isoprenylcysteine O-methyltransferase Ste14
MSTDVILSAVVAFPVAFAMRARILHRRSSGSERERSGQSAPEVDLTTRATSSVLQSLRQPKNQVLVGGLVICGIMLMLTEPSWRRTAPFLEQYFEQSAMFLIFIGMIGRTWCALYVNGRTLIPTGPYSIVREPLFIFSLIGAFGVGVHSGSFAIAALFALLAAILFFVGSHEQQPLHVATNGEYAARVSRFWPHLSAWKDSEELVVNPTLIRRTFLHTSLLLLAVPFEELAEAAHELGWVPVVLHLP